MSAQLFIFYYNLTLFDICGQVDRSKGSNTQSGQSFRFLHIHNMTRPDISHLAPMNSWAYMIMSYFMQS